MREILIGKTTNGKLVDDKGKVLLQKGAPITEAELTEIPRKYWGEIPVEETEVVQQILRDQAEGHGMPGAADTALEPENANDNLLFHDRNNRSVEQLMSDQANNALMHNMMIELMRKQFSQIQEALKEHVA